MDWIDFLGLGVLGLFAILGAVRGFVASLLAVINVLVSYGAAFLAATALAAPLASQTGMHPMLTGAGAGLITFVGVGGLLSLASRFIVRRQRRSRQRVPLDLVGGGLIGGLQGALLAVLVFWGAGQIQASGLLGEARPAEDRSALSRASQKLVEAGADAVLPDDGGGRLAARMVADPAGAARDLEKVLESPAIAELQQDELFWEYLSSGAVDPALNRGTFLRISHDAQLRAHLADLGVVDPAARDDVRAFRSSARDALQKVAPGIQALQRDGALEELASDPEIQDAVARGDTFALLRDPRILALVRRAMDATTPTPAAPEAP